MSRKTLLLYFVLSISLCAMAAPIDRQAARQTAKAFLQKRGLALPVSQKAVNTMGTRATKGNKHAAYYVFNAGNDNGFVIVSGDDRIEGVLGYTDRGTFNEQDMPENMRSFLQAYTDELKWLDSHPAANRIPATATRASVKPQVARHAIDPLLAPRWDQGAPYNLKAPLYYKENSAQGSRSAAGCVATAVAQVMNYHRYPTTLRADLPEYTTKKYGFQEIKMPLITAGKELAWQHMQDTYGTNSKEIEKNAVADLMLYVGQMLKMNYGPSSGTSLSDAVEGLKKYFGYDKGLYLADRSDYSIAEWNDLIYGELVAKRPVSYSGASSGGAHAFVIDGYDGDGLFHVNWGWGGSNDGYYRIAVLNPGDNSGIGAGSSSDGYSVVQNALIGMQQPNKDVTPSAKEALKSLTIYNTEIYGDAVTVHFLNWTDESQQYEMTLGVLNPDGSLTPIEQLQQQGAAHASKPFSAFIKRNMFYACHFTVKGLPQGTHKLVPMSRRVLSDSD